MAQLRKVRAAWKEIEVASKRWSQGDLIQLPYVVRSFAPEFPASPDSLRFVREQITAAGGKWDAPDDDVVLLEGNLPAVIVTQSCDLVETVQSEPFFLAALVDRLPEPNEGNPDAREREQRERSWRRAVAGANTSRFAISVERNGEWAHETLGKGRWYVDLRAFYPLEKGKLLQADRAGVEPRLGVPHPLKRAFALHLQERLGRDELPDRVDRDFFAPLVQRLRQLRTEGSAAEQEVLNGFVREIRYVVEPADAKNYLIQIYVCFTEDCAEGSDERTRAAALIGGIVEEFASRTLDASLRPVRFVGSDLLEMSAREYRDSTRLNWSVAA